MLLSSTYIVYNCIIIKYFFYVDLNMAEILHFLKNVLVPLFGCGIFQLDVSVI
jgi:hypothetical protein